MEKLYCVYKISCKDSNIKNAYFGSTSNFYMRTANHKHSLNNYKGMKHHLFDIHRTLLILPPL